MGRQIEDQLRDAVRSGRLMPGSELPSTRALAEDLAISRGVVERAYAQLSAEGYINLRRGANPSIRDTNVRLTLAREGDVPRARFDLRPQSPDVGAFPRHAWQRSVQAALTSASDADLGYGDPAGLWPLRVALADYLGRARGVVADPSRILITSGSTHALSLVARALARAGASSIGFENPSQRVHHAVVRRAGLEVVGIPIDDEGIDVDGLRAHSLPAVAVTPGHQFPAGSFLSESRRAELVDWARSTGALIIEDEYDAGFGYDRAPAGAVQALAPESVAYLGTTSKTLAPALRLGWAVLPEAIFADVRDELDLTILQVPALLQLAFLSFLERGELARHVRKMRALYRRRRDVLVDALESRIEDVQISGIAAGLHLVIRLDSFEEEAQVAKCMRARRIAVQTVSWHALSGYDGSPGLLVGYGAISDAAVPIVVEQLDEAIREARGSR
ncbi:MAG TPA: PLP-dependent aminotransferase family protein [Gaiellaceae bacterium]